MYDIASAPSSNGCFISGKNEDVDGEKNFTNIKTSKPIVILRASRALGHSAPTPFPYG